MYSYYRHIGQNLLFIRKTEGYRAFMLLFDQMISDIELTCKFMLSIQIDATSSIIALSNYIKIFQSVMAVFDAMKLFQL